MKGLKLKSIDIRGIKQDCAVIAGVLIAMAPAVVMAPAYSFYLYDTSLPVIIGVMTLMYFPLLMVILVGLIVARKLFKRCRNIITCFNQ
jgi:hypothetical protein